MKMENLKVWVVARWSFVVLVYGLTVAIAVDQVRMKERELAAVSKTLKNASEINRMLWKMESDARRQANEYVAKYNESSMRLMRLEGKVLVGSAEKLESLKQQLAEITSRKTDPLSAESLRNIEDLVRVNEAIIEEQKRLGMME